MIHNQKTVQVEPGSGLDRLLREAGEADIELEQPDVRFRLTRIGPRPADDRVRLADERDLWASYDPVQVRHALQQSAGALRGVDRDQLLRDLAEQSGQDSRGRPA